MMVEIKEMNQLGLYKKLLAYLNDKQKFKVRILYVSQEFNDIDNIWIRDLHDSFRM